MSRFVRQFDIHTKAHQDFARGNKFEGLKAVMYLLANGIVKLNARDLYEFWESSVYGRNESAELFDTMLDKGHIPEILRKAKSGEMVIIQDFIDAIDRLDEDTKLAILRAV
ncbi:hypothetical protein [Pseudomonas sp. XWY-1]|uniref:hypothetical protein n=1 Tax=Pseudomonas sp. XWY-1 TaxID=2069256 RepID=UPI000CF4C012|nr:hypothetical protein [Pseudomonas sp. XWY-1]